MALILCIETTTTNCSIALGRDGELISLKEDYSDNYSHSERLHLYIEQLLKENKLISEDLDAIAVSEGPGSYTGLRIGVSAAKGLCFAVDIPLLSVPTLTSLAHQVSAAEGDFIFPLLDARRMEVYTAGFTAQKDPILKPHAKILSEASFFEYLEKGVVCFIGNGVEKFERIATHPNAKFIKGKLPSAMQMLSLAEGKYRKRDFEDVAYFEPFYLKDFQAG